MLQLWSEQVCGKREAISGNSAHAPKDVQFSRLFEPSQHCRTKCFDLKPVSNYALPVTRPPMTVGATHARLPLKYTEQVSTQNYLQIRYERLTWVLMYPAFGNQF